MTNEDIQERLIQIANAATALAFEATTLGDSVQARLDFSDRACEVSALAMANVCDVVESIRKSDNAGPVNGAFKVVRNFEPMKACVCEIYDAPDRLYTLRRMASACNQRIDRKRG